MRYVIKDKALHIQSEQETTGGGSARTVQAWMMKVRARGCRSLVVHLPASPKYYAIVNEMTIAACILNRNLGSTVDVSFTTQRM